MNIYEHHEIKGWFFLPEDKDNPEKWVPGILKWDPAKGTEIELMGGLFPGFYYEVEQNGKSFPSGEVSGVVRPADDVSPIPAMFLQTTKGNRYSIFNAQRGNYSAGPFTTRNNEEHWHSTQVYVGDHVVPEEKIFTKATFYIDELYYLVNQVCQPKDDFQAGIFEGNTEDAHYSIKLPETRQLKHQRYGLEFTISEAYSAAGKTWFSWWLVEHYSAYHVNCPDGCDSGEPARGRKDPPYFQVGYGSLYNIPDGIDSFVESLLPL